MSILKEKNLLPEEKNLSFNKKIEVENFVYIDKLGGESSKYIIFLKECMTYPNFDTCKLMSSYLPFNIHLRILHTHPPTKPPIHPYTRTNIHIHTAFKSLSNCIPNPPLAGRAAVSYKKTRLSPYFTCTRKDFKLCFLDNVS